MADANRTCLVGACDREPRGLGYCGAHYQRVKKYGDPMEHVPVQGRGVMHGQCTAPGCDREITQRTLGLCAPHYSRTWRDADADLSIPVAPAKAKPIPVVDFDDGTRRCETCGERKPLDGFHRDAKSPLGRRKRCKPCRTAVETDRYWADTESVKRRVRAFRVANIEAVRARETRYYLDNREARIDAATGAVHKRRASAYAGARDEGISKRALRSLDGDACCYCGVDLIFKSFPPGERHDDQATLEHVVALSRGGTHTWGNCALACWRCNISKGARNGEWRIRAGHRLAQEEVAVGAESGRRVDR